MTTVVQAASSMVAAYLLGSFPTGLLLVRLTRGRDIRNWYSGRIEKQNPRSASGPGVFRKTKTPDRGLYGSDGV